MKNRRGVVVIQKDGQHPDRDHRGRRTLSGTVRRERRLSGEPRRVVVVTWDSAHRAGRLRCGPFRRPRGYRAVWGTSSTRSRAVLSFVGAGSDDFAIDLRDWHTASRRSRINLPACHCRTLTDRVMPSASEPRTGRVRRPGGPGPGPVVASHKRILVRDRAGGRRSSRGNALPNVKCRYESAGFPPLTGTEQYSFVDKRNARRVRLLPWVVAGTVATTVLGGMLFLLCMDTDRRTVSKPVV
jgi:hypothetical protein